MTYSNSVQNAGVEVAAQVVERALGGAVGRAGGLVVQPAVWVATGTAPDAADAMLYGAGAAGTLASSAILSGAGLVVGVFKAFMDDRIQTLVNEAKRDEPSVYRGGIAPLGDYSFWASDNHIQAMTIAAAGGVAWKHRNGALMFIRDANGRLVCDYTPRSAVEIYRPELPLQSGGNGGVRWSHRRV